MTYVLEKITLEDQEKIIKDAACDARKRLALNFDKQRKIFREFWAIDRERDYYLLRAPLEERPESSTRGFYMFFDGVIYDVYLENMFDNKTSFKPNVKPSPQLLAEITAAFTVLGRFSCGPLDKHGNPEYAVVPEFILEG
jgi:hypothetical protein